MCPRSPLLQRTADRDNCWDVARDNRHRHQDGGIFFRETLEGAHCNSNWFEGNNGELGQEHHRPHFSAAAPAVLGFDGAPFFSHALRPSNAPGSHVREWASLRICHIPVRFPHVHTHQGERDASRVFAETIDQYCGARPKLNSYNYQQAWPHARNCVQANVNILSLYGFRVPYNSCRNLEWQTCAALGQLPGQSGGGGQRGSIIFSKAPRSLNPNPRGDKPFGQCRGWRDERAMRLGCDTGFATDDIYFLEVCTFHKMCANGDELFRLRAGQPWRCELSPSGFDELQRLLREEPDWGEPKGEAPQCEAYCNEWTCGNRECKGCKRCVGAEGAG